MLCESLCGNRRVFPHRGLNPCSNGRCSASTHSRNIHKISRWVLILVLMEDALRELILRRADCQSVTVPFSENPLDFRGKSVPNRLQIYEFSRLCLTLSERSLRADALYTMSSSTTLFIVLSLMCSSWLSDYDASALVGEIRRRVVTII